jgi:nucleotide-binding universal stress UspA family protein
MGFHKPVFSKTVLGGTVNRVLRECKTDVAILIDRGFGPAKKVLVPFVGGPHDRLALELAQRLAKNLGATVTVIHVVSPAPGRARVGVQDEVNRLFPEPGQSTPIEVRVIEDAAPLQVVLREAPRFDLLIVGMDEIWGLESRYAGLRPERIVGEVPGSLLIVHRSRTNSRMQPAKPVAPAISGGV